VSATEEDASDTDRATLAGIAGVADGFDRNAALYQFLAKADRGRIERLLGEVADLPAAPHRDDVARVLYIRFASVDPATAADHAAQAVVGVPVLLGHSVRGRAIRGVEVGDGPRWVAVIGGIHQGNEANSTVLAHLLLDHFRDNPAEIPDGVGVAFIPDVNPDGAAAGTRENANGVDLNRNWDAGWRRDSYGPSGLVPGGGGTRPFSEPETRALAGYLVGRPFVAAIFLHSKGGVVVPGPGGGSVELASAITGAAQYAYLRGWTAYPLSGQASKYLVKRGIHVAIVELSTHTDPDFARNLRGLRAALAWAQELPVPSGFQPVADAEFSDACASLLGTYRARLASPLCL